MPATTRPFRWRLRPKLCSRFRLILRERLAARQLYWPPGPQRLNRLPVQPTTKPTDTPGSGIAEIDLVLDAVASREADQIEALVSFVQRPCERLEPADIRPPIPFIECREGEPTGMLVNAHRSASCEGSWWSRVGPEYARTLANIIVSWDLELYGVYLPRSVADYSYVLTSDYVAIFTSHQNGTERGIGLFLLDGGIVGTDQDCGFPPAPMVELNRLSDPVLVVD